MINSIHLQGYILYNPIQLVSHIIQYQIKHGRVKTQGKNREGHGPRPRTSFQR
jgi:hypothetical protein